MSKSFKALTEKVSKLLPSFPNVNDSAEDIAGEFEEAIAPRRTDKLPNLQDRLTVFIPRRGQTDDEIRAHAKQQFAKIAGMKPEEITRIMEKIPVQRLRTYPDDQLDTIASNFVAWEPLVRYLGDKKRKKTGSLADRFAKLYDDLKVKLERQWPQETSKCSVEDALHIVIESICEKNSKYTYEGNFFWWLVGAVNNELKGRWREPDFDSIDDHADTLPNPEEAEYQELFQKWQERYLLVETFSQEQTQGRVKAIWELMLHYDKGTDQNVVDLIKKKTGIIVNVGTLQTTRRRIRQRLEVLRFILDDVPAGAPNKPGGISVLARVKNRWGIADRDKPTLRHLAALAQAAQDEKTLAWALLARLFVDKNKTEDQVRAIVLDMLRAKNCPTKRLNVACAWMKYPGHEELLKYFRQHTKANGVGFFLSPCWYLAVLKDMLSKDAVQILRPAAGEEENWVKSL